MLQVSNSDILLTTGAMVDGVISGAAAPLFMSTFMKKSMPILAERAGRQYPYQVKLPKSDKELLLGDFEPGRIITVEKPFEGPYGVPMWFGDSSDGIYIRAGYKNGDNRLICDVLMGSSNIHGELAGATGQGKSVTLNGIIWNICTEYAPWEVNLYLLDPKIVEFRQIANSYPMPHIKSIAATGDTDYSISLLTTVADIMDIRQKIFAVATSTFNQTVSNITEFRKVTGLCMSQILVVADEFAAGFVNAGKRRGELIKQYDRFASLGRSAGVHMLVASQTQSSDVPKTTLANISCRMALGCPPDVSTQILNNDEAKNYFNKIGHLLINLNPTMDNNKEYNTLVRVPFMPGKEKGEIADRLIAAAKEIGCYDKPDAYDEDAVWTFEEFKKNLASYPDRDNRVYLGAPSFVYNEEPKCLSMQFSNTADNQNICVLIGEPKNRYRVFQVLLANLGIKPQQNVAMVGNEEYLINFNLEPCFRNIFKERSVANSRFFRMLYNTINNRKLMFNADELAFSKTEFSEEGDQIYNLYLEDATAIKSELMRCRACYAAKLMRTSPEMITAFGMNAMTDREKTETIKTSVCTALLLWGMYGLANTQICQTNAPRMFFWILGMEKILGLVRSANDKELVKLKQVMEDCAWVNVRVIATTTTFEDIQRLQGAFRWYIVDDAPQAELTKIKCQDEYPQEKATPLACLMDKMAPSGSQCKKFKKTLLPDEMFM